MQFRALIIKGLAPVGVEQAYSPPQQQRTALRQSKGPERTSSLGAQELGPVEVGGRQHAAACTSANMAKELSLKSENLFL